MASYTSVQNGAWNDPATWGGGGYPSVAGDTAVINHTVTYGLVSDVQLGTVKIANGGVLSIDVDKNTRMTFGNADLIVNSGGKFKIGSASSRLPKDYTAEFVWNTTADNSYGVTINDGAYIEIYGDPDYFGSDIKTILASDWTSGQTFTVVGDYTTKWKPGQAIAVHRYIMNGGWNYTNDTRYFTINSLTKNGDNTDITINETAPAETFYARGRVINLSRNIHFYKYGYVTGGEQYNSNRPRFQAYNEENKTYALQRRFMECVLFTGFTKISIASTNAKYVVARNGSAGFGFTSSTGNSGFVADYMVACAMYMGCVYDVFDNAGNVYRGKFTNSYFFNSYNGVREPVGIDVEDSEVFGCYFAVTSAQGCKFSNCLLFSGNGALIDSSHTSHFDDCRIFWYGYGVRGCRATVLDDCKFGWDETDNPASYASRTADFAFISGRAGSLFRNITLPSDGVKTTGATLGWFIIEDAGGDFGSVIGYHSAGVIEKDVTVLRNGGGDSSIKVTPNSYCSPSIPLVLIDSYDSRSLFSFWCESGVERMIRVYVKAYGGWTTYPTSDELYIVADYYASATTCQRTTAQSTEVLTDENWTALTVTITPQRTGFVYVNLVLAKYESSTKGIYIDTKAEIV